MRGLGSIAVVAFIAMASASAVLGQTSLPANAATSDHVQLEQQVMVMLNAARANPTAYADSLHSYRGFFHANIVVMPGQTVDYETQEGVVPVDEAITFLGQQAPLTTLEKGDTLTLSAADHVAEQGASGRTGHFSADGSSPGDRSVRRGGGPQVAEVIAYGAVDAADVIRQLIVDDGVRDRGHRALLFSPHLRYAGVSCGPHPEFGTMCVIDMADTPDGSAGGPLRRVRVAASDERKQP